MDNLVQHIQVLIDDALGRNGQEGGTMDIYWPGMFVLFYTLCGLGFTISGLYALGDWRTRRKQARRVV